MEMTMVENNNKMGNQFFGEIETEEKETKTKEQSFLEEIHDMANKAEDALAQATFQLGQATLDPDKWSERNVKTLECNVLKAKLKLLEDISSIFIDMFNPAIA